MSSDCVSSSDDLYKKVFGASEPENSHEPNHQPDNQKKSPQDIRNQNTVRSKSMIFDQLDSLDTTLQSKMNAKLSKQRV